MSGATRWTGLCHEIEIRWARLGGFQGSGGMGLTALGPDWLVNHVHTSPSNFKSLCFMLPPTEATNPVSEPNRRCLENTAATIAH